MSNGVTLASVIISGKVKRSSALHPSIMDQTRYINDNSAMADVKQKVDMDKIEIRWEDGQRLLRSHNEDEEETAWSQFLELEPFELVFRLLHVATVLIVSLFLRKTSVIWEDGLYVSVYFYDKGGHLILGPNPWKIVLFKLVLANVMIAWSLMVTGLILVDHLSTKLTSKDLKFLL